MVYIWAMPPESPKHLPTDPNALTEDTELLKKQVLEASQTPYPIPAAPNREFKRIPDHVPDIKKRVENP
jgi:hypothetical protein